MDENFLSTLATRFLMNQPSTVYCEIISPNFLRSPGEIKFNHHLITAAVITAVELKVDGTSDFFSVSRTAIELSLFAVKR